MLRTIPGITTHRRIAAFAMLATFSAFASVSVAADTVEWALYSDRSCLEEETPIDDGTGLIEVPCGDVGIYLFGSGAASASGICLPDADGQEDPPWFSPPFDARPFPDAEPDPVDPMEPMGMTPPDWLAVIDFRGPHGDSTRWLADAVSGDGATAELRTLDDGELVARFGLPVRDFHVLATLCAIAEETDVEGRAAPLVVNMSFGRKVRAVDPTDGASCNTSLTSCQIARVIEHLASRGSRFVAAAGNHRQVLFPASLDAVTHVGMLDVDEYFTRGGTLPVWESSDDVLGLFPGNTLCLDDTWAAPAGSSYSSALLAGWLGDVVLHGALPDMDPSLGRWTPLFDPTLGCHVLARDAGDVYPWCNTEVTRLFGRLAQGTAAPPCGTSVNTAQESSQGETPVGQLPALPSFDDWTAAVHPTPESDPCIPCWLRTVQGVLELDVSRSAPLSAGKYLDSIYLREPGGPYTRINVSASTLSLLAQGQLATLRIPGMSTLASGSSFWYVLKDDPNASCPAPPPTAPGKCYWSSTPIRVVP